MLMMNSRCFRRLLYLTKLEHSYRFYGRNVSQRKILRTLNSKDSTTSHQQNTFNSELQLDSLNNNFFKGVPPEGNSNPIVPQYETLEEKSTRLMKTLSLIRSRKLRERKEKILLEGKLLINDAINAGMKLRAVYFNQEEVLKEINYQASGKVDIFKVKLRTMELLSSSLPEIVGVFQRPSVDDIKLLSKPVLPVTILCDNIRDPGNLGSIIKHAASAGCLSVLLMKGCADPWEMKALKVGSGGHFHVPIINNIDWNDLSVHLPKQSKIFIADNTSDIEYWEETPELISYDSSPKECEDATERTSKENQTVTEHDDLVQINELDQLDAIEDINLPCYLYSSVIYPRENIVLYVGGETHGVDARIVKLASKFHGEKIKIPLENSMDSLNSSFALAIILYEIKRQLSEKIAIK